MVQGELASKSNSRRFIRPGLIIKSQKALGFVQAFMYQVKPKPSECILEGEVALAAEIYYASERPDLDDSLLCDCIQACGLVKNDRQIREKHLWHHKDKLNPHIRFCIVPRVK